MEQAKHTPTPWKLDRHDKHGLYDETYTHIDGPSGAWMHFARIVVRMEGDDSDSKEGLANAAFIVRAVNRDHVFDDLVKALDSVRVLIDYLKIQMEYSRGTLDKINFEHVLEREPIVRAALAKAVV